MQDESVQCKIGCISLAAFPGNGHQLFDAHEVRDVIVHSLVRVSVKNLFRGSFGVKGSRGMITNLVMEFSVE